MLPILVLLGWLSFNDVLSFKDLFKDPNAFFIFTFYPVSFLYPLIMLKAKESAVDDTESKVLGIWVCAFIIIAHRLLSHSLSAYFYPN